MSENSLFVAMLDAKQRSLKWVVAAPHTITAAALILGNLGWSLLWAQALSLVDLLPQWLCVVLFLGGIALLPLGLISTSRQGMP